MHISTDHVEQVCIVSKGSVETLGVAPTRYFNSNPTSRAGMGGGGGGGRGNF